MHGGTEPLGIFIIFFMRIADVIAPYHSVVFRQLVRLGSFPTYCRYANVTPISTSFANNRPISITSVLSPMFGRLVSVRLTRFMVRSCVLPTNQSAYLKGLDVCM